MINDYSRSERFHSDLSDTTLDTTLAYIRNKEKL